MPKKIKSEENVDIQEVKVGCIGCGAMGSALINAIAHVIPAHNIMVSNRTFEKAAKLADACGVRAVKSNLEVVNFADFIFIAVKPNKLPTLMDELKMHINSKHVIISMLAGTSIDSLSKHFSTSLVIRIMPNTPIKIGEGITAISVKNTKLNEEVALLKLLLAKTGRLEEIDENFMDAFSAICGCAPAYTFVFMEALITATVALGISHKQAHRFVSQMLRGSATLALETGTHPAILKDEVCSPAGMTIQGVKALEEHGFRHAVIKAIESAVNQAKEL
ncbi:MAG: pyrroline-5-carboxylate reductase [Treponemataceae bacterium]